MGSDMMKKDPRIYMNLCDGHDDWLEHHVLAFDHMLNMFVLTIFLILWYISLLNVVIYYFIILFILHQPPDFIPGHDPRCGQGEGACQPYVDLMGECGLKWDN